VVRHLIFVSGAAAMARVTVINDSPDFLALMREAITELGHQMIGMEAVGTNIEDVVKSRPDLLMVDLRLENRPQEISGWEMIVLAKAHCDLLDVPVILATADVWQIKQRAKDLEQIAGVHVRTKPFDMDEMCELIQTLLASANRRRRVSRGAAD
jgi:DNA-binding NtrC family response regulator